MVTMPVSTDEPWVVFEGETEKVQGAPLCEMENEIPAAVILPLRGRLVGLAASE